MQSLLATLSSEAGRGPSCVRTWSWTVSTDAGTRVSKCRLDFLRARFLFHLGLFLLLPPHELLVPPCPVPLASFVEPFPPLCACLLLLPLFVLRPFAFRLWRVVRLLPWLVAPFQVPSDIAFVSTHVHPLFVHPIVPPHPCCPGSCPCLDQHAISPSRYHARQ
ncbi:hypothetical protein EDD36DRAFT_54218 [Exophiala viscosa]|uniref:Uncharacterized protein n=1 Tax=Exophiala viscosa TaxID=2486360 RepID=A0AAN6IL36_9EURO|nr:hypothetical protein EDD36DRAFT_54218 [Exophiala viscosa]